RENHAGDPEIEDVASRVEHLGWIEAAQVLGVVRPSQGDERPERRGEPGIEDIRVLGQMAIATLLAGLWILEIRDRMAVGASPHRDPVPQPQLPGDVPVTDVAHPAQVLLSPTIRMEAE